MGWNKLENTVAHSDQIQKNLKMSFFTSKISKLVHLLLFPTGHRKHEDVGKILMFLGIRGRRLHLCTVVQYTGLSKGRAQPLGIAGRT